MRVARKELDLPCECAMCGTNRRMVVEVHQMRERAAVLWRICVPCARRLGVAAMGGRWGSR